MKHVILLFIGFIVSFSLYSQAQEPDPVISPEEFKLLMGNWEGSLTYLNYSDNQPFTMPANLVVTAGKNPYQLKVKNIYPNEPQANNESNWDISKDGRKINGKKISDKNKNGVKTVYTVSYKGKDDNKSATIKLTYILSPGSFLNKKEVRFAEDGPWILRNTFTYTKKD